MSNDKNTPQPLQPLGKPETRGYVAPSTPVPQFNPPPARPTKPK
ncbi:hypothetical protein ACT4YP_14080 [Acinetobacter baumannii]|nr:hypothetical protein [Acinetobacter baumannii]